MIFAFFVCFFGLPNYREVLSNIQKVCELSSDAYTEGVLNLGQINFIEKESDILFYAYDITSQSKIDLVNSVPLNLSTKELLFPTSSPFIALRFERPTLITSISIQPPVIKNIYKYDLLLKEIDETNNYGKTVRLSSDANGTLSYSFSTPKLLAGFNLAFFGKNTTSKSLCIGNIKFT